MPSSIELIRSTASLLVPEIILLATACVLFLVGPFLVSDTGESSPGLRHRWGVLSLIGLGVAWFAWLQHGTATMEGTLFRIDALAWYARLLSLSAGVLLVLLLWDQIDDNHSAEAYACLLTILAGTSLVAAANDLVTLFLSLELVSIPTYVILYLPRRDQRTSEAALKYFLLSIFSSALVLYGMSWLYGVAGTTNLAGIRDVLSTPTRPPHAGEGMLEIAFALLLAGLCFRITAVPFHFYAPDVFQGTTAANAAMLSVVPKVVGFVALIRLIPLSGATEGWGNWVPDHSDMLLLAVLAVITMFVGNLMALRQRHLYRLMAYSSIAHAGYMLIGLTVGDTMPVNGREAVLFYLAVYGLMTVGVFALLSAVGNKVNGEGGRGKGDVGFSSMLPAPCTTLDDIRGLSRSLPSVALLLAICLFSLTGLPPTAGFLGKLNLFFAAWSNNSNIGYGLAIILAVNAAISAWYYLRIVALMYLEPAASDEESGPRRIVLAPWLAGAVCAIVTIVIFFAPQWLWSSLR
ncbi:MAG TPA: NADH-quinone oxidoreductase subunit N [Lacipirellulaceae bacterium]|nr:NADH-quinone oxidoreductase subunit N [Lacipirellulaceae bacterium]